METRQLLRALARSWFVLVLLAIAGTCGGLLIFARTAPRYLSNVELLVTVDSDALGNDVDAVTLRQLAISRAQAIADLAPKQPAILDAEAAVGRVGTAVSVVAAAEPSIPFVDISVSGTDRFAVQAIANAFGDSLAGTVARLEGNGDAEETLANLGPASYPGEPYTPRLLVDLLPGLVIGLVLGVAVVALREVLNQTIASPDELRVLTGLRLLGAVPRERGEVRLPSLTQARGSRAEAYRQVRTALVTMSDAHVRTIAVTSALSREGKTSVSANLAVALARAGYRVALVDCDLRRPQVGGYFSLSGSADLVDVLCGRVMLHDALVARLDGRLNVLPCGSGVSEPSELLGRTAFSELITQLRADHQFVIIDTPPVLPVADALVMAPRVDGVVLVCRLGRTRQDEVLQAQRAISDAGAAVIGVVANQVASSSTRRYRDAYWSDTDAAAAAPPDGDSSPGLPQRHLDLDSSTEQVGSQPRVAVAAAGRARDNDGT